MEVRTNFNCEEDMCFRVFGYGRWLGKAESARIIPEYGMARHRGWPLSKACGQWI